MVYRLSAAEEAIRDRTRELVAPLVSAPETIDDTGFHLGLLQAMGKQGLLALFPVKRGEAPGASCLGTVLALEEVARHNALSALLLASHLALGCGSIGRAGTEAQRTRYLSPGLMGEMLLAFALTEPAAGSDFDGIETTAVRQDGGYVLKGEKAFVAGAGAAGAYLVAARTESAGNQGTGEHKEISLFLADRDAPGLVIGRQVPLMGFHSLKTGSLHFNQGYVPADSLVGPAGSGKGMIREIFDDYRILLGAVAIGLARASLESAARFAKERLQFGQPIAKFQAVTFSLAEMTTLLEAARVLVYGAASRKDDGLPYGKEAAMGKYYASEAAVRCAAKAVQIHGAPGLTDAYPVESHLRAAKLLEVAGGTAEMQKMVIGAYHAG